MFTEPLTKCVQKCLVFVSESTAARTHYGQSWWFLLTCCEFWGFTAVTLTWRWKQHGLPKRYYPTITLHGITTQNTPTWILLTCSVAPTRNCK